MLYSLRHIAPQSKFAHALHLDIFEQLIPPTLIGDVLTETQGWEEREKTLNMPMVIALIIAMGLFASCSMPHVLHKLACGLRYIWPDPRLRLPGASAISQRRQQLGVLPLRRLFERVCQPRATHETPGAFAFGLRLMAIDSTVEKVADTFANALTLSKWYWAAALCTPTSTRGIPNLATALPGEVLPTIWCRGLKNEREVTIVRKNTTITGRNLSCT